LTGACLLTIRGIKIMQSCQLKEPKVELSREPDPHYGALGPESSVSTHLEFRGV
jgi:hypothetical protein